MKQSKEEILKKLKDQGYLEETAMDKIQGEIDQEKSNVKEFIKKNPGIFSVLQSLSTL